jgi:ABC-2 type transport system ATP-binding protein
LDRIAVIDDGKVIADGTPGELKNRLGQPVIELGFGGPQQQAAQATTALSTHARLAPERDADIVRLTSADGSRLLVEVRHLLAAEELSPTTITVREPSLDDVFLALTGHSTETPTAGAVGRQGVA